MLAVEEAAEREAIERQAALEEALESGAIKVKKKEGPVQMWDRTEARRKIHGMVRDVTVDTAIKWAEYDADDYEEDGDVADWRI